MSDQQIITFNVAGGVLGYSLGDSSTALAGIPPNVESLTFVNPGSETIYVCPATDLNGNALTAGPNGGSTPVAPGTVVVISGNGVLTNSWLAAAASGPSNPLTLFVSPLPAA
jgi:hypothetical protein